MQPSTAHHRVSGSGAVRTAVLPVGFMIRSMGLAPESGKRGAYMEPTEMPEMPMKVAQDIRNKLEAAFAPDDLEIEDQSHLHAGHAGARDGGESHFHIEIVATAFDGTSRIDRQRMIHQCLAEELAGPVHALSIAARGRAEITR